MAELAAYARKKKAEPRHTSLEQPAANYWLPLDHPAARNGGLDAALAEMAAYAEAMGTEALARQYVDAATWETLDALNRKARLVAAEIETARKARAKRGREIARMPARQRRKRGSAVAFLQAQLAGGARPAAAVIDAAAARGIALRTLERAKARLGVVSRRDGFGPGSRVFWQLP